MLVQGIQKCSEKFNMNRNTYEPSPRDSLQNLLDHIMQILSISNLYNIEKTSLFLVF